MGRGGLDLWSQREGWAIDAFLAEKISLPFEGVAWQSFVHRQRLYALGSGMLAVFWFAIGGVPALSDLIILILPIAPTATGLLRAKPQLPALQALSSLTFVAAGLIAALTNGALHQTSFLWFLIAPIEGIFSAKRILAAASGILASLTALIVALLPKGDAVPVPEIGGYAPFLIPATVLALVAATGFARFRTLDRGAQKILAEADDRIADRMGCLALRFGLSGRVSSVSSNCKSLFNVAPGELMECGFFERVQVADRPAFLQAISDASATAVTATTTLRWRGPERAEHDGHAGPVFHWLEMRAHRCEGAPLRRSRDGNVVAFFRDVTEAKRRDAELETARADLLEANVAKELFFAHAGHEIRAPLNAIAGFSELLADPGLSPPEPEKQREYARIIHESGQHLLAVVNSLADMSLIQSGRLPIALERFAAAPQIDLCCDMLGLQARSSGVLLLRAYSANLDTIVCDRRLFTQILVNLISNAIKFTPANGRVTLIARTGARSLLIKVTDTGIGIDAEDLGHLGDPFFQAKGVSERQDKGTGLGLSIVRGFIGILGGEIMVASEPEKGTCVRVRLPLESHALTGTAKGPVRIATLARLPLPDEPVAIQQMMVKKIA
jgi:two-component system, cell cycle sensor histidine kinase DivJ